MKVWVEIREKITVQGAPSIREMIETAEYRGWGNVYAKKMKMPSLPPIGTVIFPYWGDDDLGELIVTRVSFYEDKREYVVSTATSWECQWDELGWIRDEATELMK